MFALCQQVTSAETGAAGGNKGLAPLQTHSQSAKSPGGRSEEPAALM